MSSIETAVGEGQPNAGAPDGAPEPFRVLMKSPVPLKTPYSDVGINRGTDSGTDTDERETPGDARTFQTGSTVEVRRPQSPDLIADERVEAVAELAFGSSRDGRPGGDIVTAAVAADRPSSLADRRREIESRADERPGSAR